MWNPVTSQGMTGKSSTRTWGDDVITSQSKNNLLGNARAGCSRAHGRGRPHAPTATCGHSLPTQQATHAGSSSGDPAGALVALDGRLCGTTRKPAGVQSAAPTQDGAAECRAGDARLTTWVTPKQYQITGSAPARGTSWISSKVGCDWMNTFKCNNGLTQDHAVTGPCQRRPALRHEEAPAAHAAGSRPGLERCQACHRGAL
jgi:hypothetical protein